MTITQLSLFFLGLVFIGGIWFKVYRFMKGRNTEDLTLRWEKFRRWDCASRNEAYRYESKKG